VGPEAETATARKLFAAETPLKKFLYISHCRRTTASRPPSRRSPRSWARGGRPAEVDTGLPPGRQPRLHPRPVHLQRLGEPFRGLRTSRGRHPRGGRVEKRYAALTEEFGFACRPAEDWINGMGYSLLRNRKKPDEAVAMFRYGVRCYPESANTYDSLADAYEAQGQARSGLGELQDGLPPCRESSGPEAGDVPEALGGGAGEARELRRASSIGAVSSSRSKPRRIFKDRQLGCAAARRP